jgi:4-amino-4-deoxy-L-arabinose transferase-like glycosyltransferase
MLTSFKAFFYVCHDPHCWVSVDKPPVALWLQALSARLFGFSSWSLLLPQAVEGLLSVALLYLLVRRSFGRTAGLIAGLALAFTPISVAADRYNNVDPCLMVALVAAAGAYLLAAERGSRGWLLAGAALSGAAFNVKMLAGLISLPVFFGLYFVAAPRRFALRLKDLAWAATLVAAVSLSWITAFDLTPPAHRPFAGSTQGNSMLELSFGWNGLQRLSRDHRFHGLTEPLSPTAAAASTSEETAQGASLAPFPANNHHRGMRGAGMGGAAPGWSRLAQPVMAGQCLWFLPLGLLGALWALLRAWNRTRNPPPIGFWGRVRHLFVGNTRLQGYALWGAWLAIHAAILSYCGVMHVYYLVLLAPATAALTGAGIAELLEAQRVADRSGLLASGLLLGALWQVPISVAFPDWYSAFAPFLALGAALGALLILLEPELPKLPCASRWSRVGAAVALFSLSAAPLAWALTPVLSAAAGAEVQADPAALSAPDTAFGRVRTDSEPERAHSKMLAYLRAHRDGAEYLVAAAGSQSISPLLIAQGDGIALGGFMGSDPIIDLPKFLTLVSSGSLHFYLVAGRARWGAAPGFTGGSPGGKNGSPEAIPGAWGGRNGVQSQAIETWVREHGHPVDPSLWRDPGSDRGQGFPGGDPENAAVGPTRPGQELYRLDPPDTGGPDSAGIRRVHPLRHWRKWNPAPSPL